MGNNYVNAPKFFSHCILMVDKATTPLSIPIKPTS